MDSFLNCRKALSFLLATTSVLGVNGYAGESASTSEDDATLPEVRVEAATRKNAPSEQTGSYTARNSNAATGLDLSLRDTPQSVTVITKSQMDDFHLTNINDVLDSATGIVVERVETDRTYYTARGSDVQNFQMDGIGLPLDFGLATGDIDTAVFDRIEIIRGANGLMSATGNPSATVNFVRKRPTRDFKAELDLTGGSWSSYRAEGDVSGSLNAAGTVRGRVVGVFQDKDSYLDRYGHEKKVAYGILEADLSDNTMLTVGHTYQQNNANGVLWGALPLIYTNGQRINYDVSASTAPDWAFWDSKEHRTFLELAHQFNNGWEAKGILTRRQRSENSNMLYIYGTPDNNTDLDMGLWPSTYTLDNEQWIADIYAKGPFSLAGREHELVVGASLSRSEMEEESRYGASLGTNVSLNDVLAGNISNTTYPAVSGTANFVDKRSSGYAAAHLNITDKLKFIGGARITSVESSGESYAVPHAYKHNNKVTPYAGIVYALNDVHSAYASYTRIFNPQFEVDINRQPLAPLEGDNYEAGIKSEWLGKKLNTAVSVFRTKQDNVAEIAGTIPLSVDSFYRGVRAISQGLEFDISGEVTDRLKVQGGYTAMSLKDNNDNEVKTYTPRHLLKLSTTYRVPMVDNLKVGMSVKWRGDIYKDINGTRVTQDSYALLDLMAEYQINDKAALTFNMYNVTDEKYLTSLMWDQSFYGTPRSASLTLSWKY